MSEVLLVVNAGSSSLKFSVFTIGRGARLESLYRGEIDGLGARPHFVAHDATGASLANQAMGSAATHDDALGAVLDWIEARATGATVVAAGHRVVHGGVRYAAPIRVTPDVLQELEALVLLAPLHQPHNLAPIRSLMKRKAELPQIACFDTAFHATQEDVARTFALPYEGLPMGTRTGSIDPGVILHLLTERRMSPDAVTELLYKKSGLLGMSGVSSDVRDLLASDSPRAAWALDVFVYRVGRELGSLAAALGGLDALVFTAGIGEHAAPIRARVCRNAAWLGIRLDEAANGRGGPCLSVPGSPASAWVIPTNEELMIARHTLRLIGA